MHSALSKGWVVVNENTVVGPWEPLAECDGSGEVIRNNRRDLCKYSPLLKNIRP
jgi:hypothetical protein